MKCESILCDNVNKPTQLCDEPKKGFQFRIGVTPARMIAADNIYDRKTVLMPYISFGKAF